jgi:HAD superfamily hydrolase (TIGR01509 family)
VGSPRAFLVDVYETILTCDFEVLRNALPVIADADPHDWGTAFARLGPDLTQGRITLTHGFEQILAACGIRPQPALVRELIRKDRELLFASSRLYDDAIPFLQTLQSGGVRIGLVSNCIENTRPLLADLGVSELADAMVLSCEVGYAKPDARIYHCALDRLGVTADVAVFIDDQPSYCAGATAAGLTALQITRSPAQLLAPAPGSRVIGSLLEATLMM